MKNIFFLIIITFIFFINLTAQDTIYFNKNWVKSSKDSVIYLNDEADSIMHEKTFNDRCLTLNLNTFKDNRKLISFMENKFN